MLKSIVPARQWTSLKEFVARHFLARNLRLLATLYGSDKWGEHWYARHYERHFSSLRKEKIVLLEIGIGGYNDPHAGGASLRMWKHYFPHGRIYGIDVFDKSPHNAPRIRTFVGDQSDEHFLRRVISEIGRPQIVIDDGSHINSHVIKSFEVLFPLLADDGIYVIEDVATSYWPTFGGSNEDIPSAPTSMNLMKKLVDGLNHKEFLRRDYKPTLFDEHIVSMHFYHNLVFCHKGPNAEKGSRQLMDVSTA
ncbi:MAG TPA: hypothetical protein VMD31_08485 [Opitutaceae bacterium]|nr:hypothetical protein [Opitutaceae bacterium]